MRLGIDTGGTFTDAVLYDNKTGVVKTAKALTTHQDLALGIREAISRIDTDSIPLSQFVEVTSISTTLATNSIVEGRGGTICLLMIGHSTNSLKRASLKEALRDDPVEFIEGGHTAHGDELQPLDLESAKTAILRHASVVSAFAVAGMFSVRNTAHEVAIRDLVLELTDRPVTCTFELTANLDAPRRAMTAVLNARLVAPISQLIQAVRLELANREIHSPLMVVKGDGSMISADVAIVRPVETILSGPAASIVGACNLAKTPVSVVSDIGGTTTDIAILRDGKPVIAPQGAHIGGFRTFVEAVDVYTVGLGGDSQVSFDCPVQVGPNRALPISSLGRQNPEIIKTLKDQLTKMPQEYQGCFLLRRRSSENIQSLGKNDRKLWDLLANGPVSCESLFRDPQMNRAFNRLRRLDLVHMSAFTPTDALHVLGKMNKWSIEGAVLAAQIWSRGFERRSKPLWDSPEDFCKSVLNAVIHQSSDALIRAAIASESPDTRPEDIGSYLLNKGIDSQDSDVLNVRLSLKGALVVVGAPANSFYPEIANRLNTQLEIPEHCDVGNAVGAAAGSISQRVSGLITSPAEGIYRSHTPFGIQDFRSLKEAAESATSELENLAHQRAISSQATDSETSTKRSDIVVQGIGGQSIFIESRITVIVSGVVDSNVSQ